MAEDERMLTNYVISIDNRVAALREDQQQNHERVQAALVDQQKEYSETLQHILLTVQDIQNTMVKKPDCATCQGNFITRKEVRTIVVIGTFFVTAAIGTIDFLMNKAGDIMGFLQKVNS